jgi:RNA polymerase sigma-70 factor (sigma-E family)
MSDSGRQRRTERKADFSAFVAGTYQRQVRLAELLTGDRHRAEDLVQDALVRAYPRWDRIRADDPSAYIRRAVLNGHRTWWTRRHLREVLTDVLPDRVTAGDHAADYEQRDLAVLLLSALTGRERAVIVLRFYADLAEAAIAAELGIAPGTVKSTLARALGKLRAHPALADRDPQPLLTRKTR